MSARSTKLAVLIAVAVSSVAGTAQARRFVRESRRTVPLSQLVRLHVQNATGRTVVVGREDREDALIVVSRVVHARGADQASARFEALRVEVAPEGNALHVVVHRPDRIARRGLWAILRGDRGAWVDLTIEVPRRMAARVRSSSGDVRISDLDGAVTVTTTSGDASIRNVGGPVRIDATSGDVEVHEGAGPVRVSSTSGNVLLTGVAGDVVVDATSGDVEVHEGAGPVRVNSTSGDVRVETVAGDVRVETSSGDVQLRDLHGGLDVVTASGDVDASIVADVLHDYRIATSSGDVNVGCREVRADGLRIDVRTASGSITAQGPIEIELTRRDCLVGRIGPGRSSMRIETASGNVRVVAVSARVPRTKR